MGALVSEKSANDRVAMKGIESHQEVSIRHLTNDATLCETEDSAKDQKSYLPLGSQY